MRKEPNSISGGCPRINWGVSVYQLGAVHLLLSIFYYGYALSRVWAVTEH